LLAVLIAFVVLGHIKKPNTVDLEVARNLEVANMVVTRFNELYYYTGVWKVTTFLGVESMQNPCDNWVLQEMITAIKPDFLIETGTAYGGTSLFYAMILEQVNPNGKVITIDIAPDVARASQFDIFKRRVEVVTSDSVAPDLIASLKERTKGHTVLVVLDSLHTKEHVLKELNAYSPLVSMGSYIVVADTNINGHPVLPEFGPGPREAVDAFLPAHPEFVPDRSKEKFFLTFYPKGFLKRVK
jgi:cephalosporin hydroxylase